MTTEDHRARTEAATASIRRIRFPRRWPGRLAAIAVAVAVIAIAATLVAVNTGTQPAPVTDLSIPASGTSAAAFVNGVPRYYVTLGSNYTVPNGTGLIVGDAITGKILATVPRPKGAAFDGVTSAGDGRTFVVNAITLASDPTESWYVLRILPGAAGHIQLTTLPITDPYADALVAGLALSPNGHTLAVMDLPNGRNPHLTLPGVVPVAQPITAGAVTLRTYAVPSGQLLRTWTHPYSGAVTDPDGDNWADLSWLADGHTLGFEYPFASVESNASNTGTFLTLDTTRPGTDLIGAARVLLKVPAGNACLAGDAMLSPDGSTLFCAGSTPAATCKTGDIYYATYSAKTPNREHLLYRTLCIAGQVALIAWVGSDTAMIGLATGLPAQGYWSPGGLITTGKLAPLEFSLPEGNQPGAIAF